MNLVLTALICIGNPILAYTIIKFLGLEIDAPEYVFDVDPQLGKHFVLISTECLTIMALSMIRVPHLTFWLLFWTWLQICLHISSFVAISLYSLELDYLFSYLIDGYVCVLYPAIIILLHSFQLYLLVYECGTRIGLEYKRRAD